MKKFIASLFLIFASINAFAVTELKDDDFSAVVASKVPVVVEFYATWCGPCKAMAPLIEAAEKHYNGKVKFFKVDIDKQKKLAQGIEAVPTIILVANGRVVGSGAGVPPSLEVMINAIDKALAKNKGK